jgi:Protein of unknown function (DUF642)/PEP-CTERM motif
MKQASSLGTAFGAAAVALTLSFSAGSVQAQSLVNGDFEAYVWPANSSAFDFVNVAAGAGTIAGWTVGGQSVDLIKTFPANPYNAIVNTSVDMVGYGSGSISQTFIALANTVYTLTFDLWANYAGGPNFPPNDLTVSLGTTTNTFVTPAVNPGAFTSQSVTWTSIAGGLTTVSFAAVAGGNLAGAVVDNAVLTAAPVPEPESYALLLAGLLAVGFVARRRQA